MLSNQSTKDSKHTHGRLWYVLALIAIQGASLASTAGAATLAYWRFEGDGTTVPAVGDQVEDTNGRNIGVTFPNAPGVAVLDSSGNGNTLRAWEHSFAGHNYQADVPAAPLASALPNTLSIQNAGSFPASFTWSLKSAPTVDVEPIKPLAWTIEASIKQTATTGFHNTFVGRDGNRDVGVSDANAAPLYFKTEGGVLRILFRDEAGNFYNLGDPTGALTLDTWYNVAAVSDGTTLSLYKGAGTGGYTLVNSMALTPGDTRLSYDDDGSTTAGDTQWGWTVGRGRYGGSDAQGDAHVDRWFGSIDEVRISDSALTENQFLFAAVPEPSTAVMATFAASALVLPRLRNQRNRQLN